MKTRSVKRKHNGTKKNDTTTKKQKISHKVRSKYNLRSNIKSEKTPLSQIDKSTTQIDEPTTTNPLKSFLSKDSVTDVLFDELNDVLIIRNFLTEKKPGRLTASHSLHW